MYEFSSTTHNRLRKECAQMKMLLGEILKEKDLTYREAAERTGVGRSTLFDISNGFTMPRIDTLEEIAKGLSVKITDLFESIYK